MNNALLGSGFTHRQSQSPELDRWVALVSQIAAFH